MARRGCSGVASADVHHSDTAALHELAPRGFLERHNAFEYLVGLLRDSGEGGTPPAPATEDAGEPGPEPEPPHGQPAEAKAVEAFLPATTLSYVLRRCAPPPTTLPLPTLAPEALSQSQERPVTIPNRWTTYFVGEGENRRFFRVRGAPPPPPGEAPVLVELHEGRPVTIPYDERWT